MFEINSHKSLPFKRTHIRTLSSRDKTGEQLEFKVELFGDGLLILACNDFCNEAILSADRAPEIATLAKVVTGFIENYAIIAH